MAIFKIFHQKLDDRTSAEARISVRWCRYKAQLVGLGSGTEEVLVSKEGWVDPFRSLDGVCTNVQLDWEGVRAFLMYSPETRDVNCIWTDTGIT
jgi:hypothetical protein